MRIQLIHQLFEKQSKNNPTLAIIENKDRLCSHLELNEKAEKIAALLEKLGVNKNVPVGIYAKSSLSTFCYMLGALKAQGLYVPLNIELPFQTIEFILKDAQIHIVLTHQSLSGFFSTEALEIIPLFDDWVAIRLSHPPYPQPIAASSHLAYILYTSGTTGKPKGVMVSHENLIWAYLGWEKDYGLKEENFRHLQMANFAFDVFTGEWVRALCSGGTLIICEKPTLLNPEKLYDLMVEFKVNIAEFVPAVLRKLAQYLEFKNLHLDYMKTLICGSDSWTIGEYKYFKRFCIPGARLINSYGLTEATIDSAFYECHNVSELTQEQTLVPIGRSFHYVKIYILDENLKEVKRGTVGEICIGGKTVSQGYLNQTALNREKFIKNPFDRSSMLLKTGDLGSINKAGDIEFLGRKDSQTKIYGYRIELSAIEAVLNEYPSIKGSLVSVEETSSNHEHLSAWLELEKEKIEYSKLQAYLLEKLPPYMIPRVYYNIDHLPLTENRKINRKAILPRNRLFPSGLNKLESAKNEFEEFLVVWLKEHLGLEEIATNEPLYHIGLNSLQITSLATCIELKHKIAIEPCKLMPATIEKIGLMIQESKHQLLYS